MKNKTIFILLLFLVGWQFVGVAQTPTPAPPKDTTAVKPKVHSPNKAALMSAIVPGLGQAYNKKYWKIPIVYAAIGATLYFAIHNNKGYKEFKSVYVQRINGNTSDPFQGVYTNDNIKTLIGAYRQNRDLSLLLCGLSYLLNIVDAGVDAHLFHFNVNDDLSLRLQPSITYGLNQAPFTGITLALNILN